jgi:uracil-DNA glycosylase
MALRSMLAGWRQDLSTPWRTVLAGTRLNWTRPELEHELLPGEIIFPGRKGTPIPTAPKGAHLLFAFENTDPHKVRAVILGQDPYSNVAWATGRAFEQGNLTHWPDEPRHLADSLRRLVQAIVAARTGDPSYLNGDRAWRKLANDARNGLLQLEPPCQLFDRLEREGVMFLNSSLTISILDQAGKPKQCRRYFHFWAPLIDGALRSIATRQSGYAIFLLLGRHAADIFDRCGAKTEAVHAGIWRRRVDAIHHFHPAAITSEGPAFLRPPNPFCSANKLLQRMGADPISW